ncbi:hypothetical protein D3C72_1824170 [compost metagenome]
MARPGEDNDLSLLTAQLLGNNRGHPFHGFRLEAFGRMDAEHIILPESLEAARHLAHAGGRRDNHHCFGAGNSLLHIRSGNDILRQTYAWQKMLVCMVFVDLGSLFGPPCP